MQDRVTEYARKVVNGEVFCGQLHKLACQRHLNDLERSETDDYPYYWDVEQSERVLEYAETLTIAEGMEPKPVVLIPSQIFDIGCTFGWRKKKNGYRRFRRRYKSMARQNGKTFENGIMGTYIAGFSGYRYGKLFTVATKKRQARLAWEEMSKFISIDSDLQELFDVKDYKSVIEALNTLCTIEALSKEAGLDDGFRSIFSSIDEIHQHKDNKIYKALYNGTRSLPETLVSMITTRGEHLNTFCYEIDTYAQNILKGLAVAEDFFVDIYCLDEGDDLWDPKNYIKANPFICIDEERFNTLLTDAQTARDMGGQELRDFITKCLNMWVVNTDNQFMDPEAWKKCGSKRKLADIAEITKQCYVGLDLSSSGDLTTLSLEFPLLGEKFYLYSHSFMPRGRLDEHIETDLAPYDYWVQQGLITVTGGETSYMNDFKFIIRHLKELKDRYSLEFLGIGIDPHNASALMQDLEEFGCPVVVITQSARSLNDATVAIKLLTKSGSIEYDQDNELLTWSVINAAITRNSFDEIKIDKKPGAQYKRIDPVDASVDSHALYLLNKQETQADLEGDLTDYLALMGWKE